MQFAIISDIHANVEALSAVLADIPAQSQLLHLGDLVGYGPQPNEVVSMIAGTRGVCGNHDLAALGDQYVLSTFVPLAAASAVWTGEQLNASSRAYLGSLPYTRTISDDASFPFLLSHGSPNDPTEFDYVMDNRAAMKAVMAISEQVCFVGHSHFPESFGRPAGSGRILNQQHGTGLPDDVLAIADGAQYIINVGSVGQPRDRNPMACYALFDTTLGTITWRRVPYDIAAVQAKIADTPLPKNNASRLAVGK